MHEKKTPSLLRQLCKHLEQGVVLFPFRDGIALSVLYWSASQASSFSYPVNPFRCPSQAQHIGEAELAEDGAYIAGMDVGGEDRPKPGDESEPTGKRHSTVITIGHVRYNELDLPRIEVVHQIWWEGMIPIRVLRDIPKMREVRHRTQMLRIVFQLVKSFTHLGNHLIKGC